MTTLTQTYPLGQLQADWQLQDAKNRFSQVVRAAREGVPQWVTVHGKRAVVVLSSDEYEALAHRATPVAAVGKAGKSAQSFLEQLRGSGKGLGLTDTQMDALFARDRSAGRAHPVEF
jgi:prevent-host-death family protein